MKKNTWATWIYRKTDGGEKGVCERGLGGGRGVRVGLGCKDVRGSRGWGGRGV